jgi:ABC-type iron transport system FetAB permease component
MQDPDIPSLTAVNVLIASSFVLVNALISLIFGLGMEGKILVSASRCVVQLVIMGQFLQPIFDNQDPILIGLMSILLLILAVCEVYFSRVAYRHDLMLWSVFGSIGISVFTIGNLISLNYSIFRECICYSNYSLV